MIEGDGRWGMGRRAIRMSTTAPFPSASRRKEMRRFVALQALTLWLIFVCCTCANYYPEPTSTLLRIHRLYQQPPHETSLYDALHVAPNATLNELTRSYRKLSRKYHPDKPSGDSNVLETIRQSYDILKSDGTRLPYHKYGLKQVSDAAFLLTGSTSPRDLNSDQRHLLRLMGHVPEKSLNYHDRVIFLATELVERIRPLVEDVVSPSTLLHTIAEDCSRLRKLPLGTSILRCIGRGYRHSGQQVLREEKFRLAGQISNKMRQSMHLSKHWIEAATVGGKLLVQETLSTRNGEETCGQSKLIEGHFEEGGEDSFLGSDNSFHEDFVRKEEQRKAQEAVKESLQIKALWKVSKIQLDKSVRDACELVLDCRYFLFPNKHGSRADGWITPNGKSIAASVARIRAAKALVLIGNEIVRCAA